uniref:Uncharacterized protein n=1 Tax=Equus caballus TaxID=9796 RepID=F6VQQ0_HORSE
MLKKADVTNKDCKSQSEEQETSLLLLGPVAADPKGCVTIAIHAKPGSKQHAIPDVTAEAVSMDVAAPPLEGEVNTELCCYCSEVLDLRKSDVRKCPPPPHVLDKGGKSHEKAVKIWPPQLQKRSWKNSKWKLKKNKSKKSKIHP